MGRADLRVGADAGGVVVGRSRDDARAEALEVAVALERPSMRMVLGSGSTRFT